MFTHASFLQLYKEENVILGLLLLIKLLPASAGSRSSSRCWSAVQMEELRLHALQTLCTIAPLMLHDYMSCHGSAFVLRLLDWCTQEGQGVNKWRISKLYFDSHVGNLSWALY